jgi:uncharacterized membrane protein
MFVQDTFRYPKLSLCSSVWANSFIWLSGPDLLSSKRLTGLNGENESSLAFLESLTAKACAEFVGLAAEYHRVSMPQVRVLRARPIRVREGRWGTELFGDYHFHQKLINLFPPEAVMQHQQAVGLSEEQKNNLKVEVRQAQLKFTELQWTLQDEMERLVSLLKQPKVDEKQAASQLDKVLAAEHEIKRAQLMLLIRIKNNLTPSQQTQLRELVEKSKVR